ncbi:SMP-30/gluconolactonase/LRE family protein [Flavisphingomonas formosensis]|uniref:SMP-30/gluconolactonase/LRE family protein n=1 Tax=Flavisphingomonas formosensis TaxID=861534 RepID=UPI0012F86812|nr:SMP-30/gluconolactonase/LRE family protein [Sphingomonas formosensis]
MSSYRIVERARKDRLGEGIIWCLREQRLFWVDILGQRIHRLAIEDGSIDTWDVPEPIGWIFERRDEPGFIAGLKSGFAMIQLDPFALRPLASPEPHLPSNRMNDALVDSSGRIWAGTMSMDGSRADGALYRLDPDLSWHRLDTGYHIANGPAISTDGEWLYHTDSALGRVYRYARREGGALGPRERFIDFAQDWGSPDGMTVDCEGGLWIAHWGGSCVSRFTPDGARERSIALPASQITNCTFAGPGLDRMFVTSASDGVDEEHGGALFEVETGLRGLPPHAFAG